MSGKNRAWLFVFFPSSLQFYRLEHDSGGKMISDCCNWRSLILFVFVLFSAQVHDFLWCSVIRLLIQKCVTYLIPINQRRYGTRNLALCFSLQSAKVSIPCDFWVANSTGFIVWKSPYLIRDFVTFYQSMLQFPNQIEMYTFIISVQCCSSVQQLASTQKQTKKCPQPKTHSLLGSLPSTGSI